MLPGGPPLCFPVSVMLMVATKLPLRRHYEPFCTLPLHTQRPLVPIINPMHIKETQAQNATPFLAPYPVCFGLPTSPCQPVPWNSGA